MVEDRSVAIKDYYDRMTREHKEDGSLDYGDHIGNLIVHRSIQNDPARLYQIIEKEISSYLKDTPAMKFFDAGCGYGGTSIYLAERFSQHHYTGVTLSPSQEEIGTAAIKQRKLSNVQLKVKNYHDFEENEMYDWLIAVESLAHSNDHKKTLSIWAKHIKPGGKLLIVDDFLKDETERDEKVKEWETVWLTNYSKVSEWVKIANELGLEVIRKDDLYRSYGFPTQTEEDLLKGLKDYKERNVHPGYVGALLLEWLYSHNQTEYNLFILQKK